jgi:hypothetical protein
LIDKLKSNFYAYDRIVREILTLGREGVNKKTIIDKLSLSEPLVRKITAELVNKDLLRYHRHIEIIYDHSKRNLVP